MEQAAHQNLVLEIDQIDLPYTRSTLLSSKLDHDRATVIFTLVNEENIVWNMKEET